MRAPMISLHNSSSNSNSHTQSLKHKHAHALSLSLSLATTLSTSIIICKWSCSIATFWCKRFHIGLLPVTLETPTQVTSFAYRSLLNPSSFNPSMRVDIYLSVFVITRATSTQSAFLSPTRLSTTYTYCQYSDLLYESFLSKLLAWLGDHWDLFLSSWCIQMILICIS